jgi:NhaA family Na+:H+ antiporter
VVGKPLGITLFAWIAVQARLARLPEGVSWAQLAGTGVVAGIGFTVSLFIAELAFDEQTLVDEAKIGVLFASVVTGATGFAVLRAISHAGVVHEDVRGTQEGKHEPTAAG